MQLGWLLVLLRLHTSLDPRMEFLSSFSSSDFCFMFSNSHFAQSCGSDCCVIRPSVGALPSLKLDCRSPAPIARPSTGSLSVDCSFSWSWPQQSPSTFLTNPFCPSCLSLELTRVTPSPWSLYSEGMSSPAFL